ncbi:MAG: hypothetical protein IH623_09495 [Verrucomicrobia bacterium]|nr:hypothetical protein [Verrucomicrobiota bacterium]
MSKPFVVEIGPRTVTLTAFGPVPHADYLQPLQSFRISLKDWQALVANGGPAVGRTAYFNFPPAALAAHGVTTGEPT